MARRFQVRSTDEIAGSPSENDVIFGETDTVKAALARLAARVEQETGRRREQEAYLKSEFSNFPRSRSDDYFMGIDMGIDPAAFAQGPLRSASVSDASTAQFSEDLAAALERFLGGRVAAATGIQVSQTDLARINAVLQDLPRLS